MRLVLATIGVFLIGCYSDPDYGATRFKCDAAHACPADQRCVDGACTGGAGVAGTVACGSASCAADQKCCSDFLGGLACVALADSCAGTEAACDGIEDCNGNACCASLAGFSIACGAATCDDQICLDASDCTSDAAKQCCLGGGDPWGHCKATCTH